MLLNGGLLSEIKTSGIPWTANILSSFGITATVFVECTMSTSGNREYLSITTSRYSFVCRGPKSQHVMWSMDV